MGTGGFETRPYISNSLNLFTVTGENPGREEIFSFSLIFNSRRET